MRPADRLEKLPPYLFAAVDEAKARALARGVDVIDMGVGDPDIPTPPEMLDALASAVRRYENQFYPAYDGAPFFREAVARWYRRRSGVSLDPDRHVVGLIGSKEGLAHLPLAFVNPGDLVLYTEPCYPVVRNCALLAGGEVFPVPLRRENRFLVDFSSIPDDVARRAVLFYVNYPNNPTAALADEDFLSELVAFARRWDILIAYDHAYSELVFDGARSPSILEVDGALDVALEFCSVSKMFSAAGWRVAWAAGCETAVSALKKVKTNVDSGAFTALQEAAAWALDELWPSVTLRNAAVYAERRDAFCSVLADAGLDFDVPPATFFLWLPVGGSSVEKAADLLESKGVLAIPGAGSGPAGEGFLRFALNLPVERVREAARKTSDYLLDK